MRILNDLNWFFRRELENGFVIVIITSSIDVIFRLLLTGTLFLIDLLCIKRCGIKGPGQERSSTKFNETVSNFT